MSSVVKKLQELKFRFSASEFRVVFPVFLFIFIAIGAAIAFATLGRKEIVLRKFAPKDSLVYLETNDLGGVLQKLTEAGSFKENSASTLDFSVVKGMQMAVVISGFETSENKVTDEKSVLNFKPKFTAIAETHAWSWQVSTLVENNLNDFVKKTYGSDTKFEKKSVNGTERIIWTAADGRKTFAVVSGSQVFFGNDEDSINKCLSVKRDESESIFKNEAVTSQYGSANEKLAFGFVSQEGIKQISDFAGVSVAVDQAEDGNARGFISRILPQILKNATREITWTAEKKEDRIQDRINIKTTKEVSQVLSETLIPSSEKSSELYDFLPQKPSSVTRYNLKNPQVGFRSLLLTTAKNTDTVSGKIISQFSNSLLSPYGIKDAELFLSVVRSELVTAIVDENGDDSIAVAKVNDLEKAKKSLLETLKPDSVQTAKLGIEILRSEEDGLSIAIIQDVLLMGSSESVEKSLSVWNKRKISPIEPEKDFTKSKIFSTLQNGNAVAATISDETPTAQSLLKVLGEPKPDGFSGRSVSLVETRFNQKGIERVYLSDFGFIGSIVKQFEVD